MVNAYYVCITVNINGLALVGHSYIHCSLYTISVSLHDVKQC